MNQGQGMKEKGSLVFNGDNVSIFVRVLEKDGGEGCTPTSVYSMSVNIQLKTANTAHFNFHVYHHNLRKMSRAVDNP